MPRKEISWYQEAANLIVRKGVDIYRAVVLMNLMMSREEAEGHFRSDVFQKVLQTTRGKHYADIANDPGHNKRSLVGKLLVSAEALIQEGKHDKAAEVLHKIAKIEGWERSGENITVIGDLTQKDLADIKARLENNLPDKKTFADA